ncbi:guanylate cyclase 32E isoform X1 [Pectinophora gossypiella]|uniref:guanylate cyclase 32E isoform X1 n=1 Tax=Pectinophora gossypiella TaxID=13191 RepID=UPI00214E0F94|nr:guanylate cyclase 32E isoform X1 [Pectinophora gossypiella]
MKNYTWNKWHLWCLLMLSMKSVQADRFTLGYITGSQRRPGDLSYQRPGRVISGAISMAVEEVNEKLLGPMGHSLDFIVAETYGQEEVSIRQVAALWAANVSAFIGPQETCVHEGRMAAAFNLPMISYYCRDVASSNKRVYATFARTRPSDIDISRSVVAVLTHFNFMHVAFVYLKAPNHDFSRLALAIIAAAREKQISIRTVQVYRQPYYYENRRENFTRNPFLDIVRDTYKDTRIYVSVGYYHDHIGLMLALEAMQLLDSGEYAAIGVDVDKYESDEAVRYLAGPLRKEPADRTLRAFRSYLAVAPSPSPSYPIFAKEVNRRLQMPPFNFTNPLLAFGGGKVIPVEAAWLHDAVWVYARALAEALSTGEGARDGRAIATRMRNTTYRSVMGYWIHMDECGDAEGNYTLLSMDPSRPPGLYPLAVLHKSAPEVRFLRELKWPGGRVPLSEPPCGFRGEKCASHVGAWALGACGGTLALLVLAALALYRGWRYEQELDSLLWKIDFRDLHLPEEDQRNKLNSSAVVNVNPSSNTTTNSEKGGAGGSTGGVRSSQVSLSSNPDLDFRYSAIFTEVAFYRGRLLAVKRVRRHHIDINREIKKELKIMRDLQHDNVNGFVGACIEPPNVCALSEYCTRGSLKDILENEDIKLDNMFIASLVGDIIRGMIFIQESPIQYHGALRPSNCLVDARWVVKLADFGLREFRRGESPPTEPNALRAHVESAMSEQGIEKSYETFESELLLGLVYLSPELLRSAGWGIDSFPVTEDVRDGSPASDVYAFGLVLYELHTRRGPFGPDAPPAPTLLRKIAKPEPTPYRPPLDPLADRFDCVRECCCECWLEEPTARPDFKSVRTKLRPLRKGMKPNIFDNMIAMMEKYANNLEVLVDERTDQLQEEKKKTEALLEEMLPAPVADQLKRGRRVLPESYDSVTIYFSDIVGFTAMSAESTPLQVVDFLNDLYTCFDSILENFDVYKVETIGDAYMVVSGLPIRNGIEHAGEVASMALALLSATRVFRVRHRPDHRLLLRVGLHSGPVCAGVVGLKMPRYCLFGDTVNTASRFESTGAPLKIHCSAACKTLLDQLGGYILEERGVVSMKGKRDQVTYWLRGEEPKAAAMRARRRAQRDDTIQPLVMEKRGQRSSLKSRNWKNQVGGLHRCCSLESPKKLRFASGSHLESHTDSVLHHRSDEYLMEVIGDGRLAPVQRGDLLETPYLRHEYTSVSCPIIEHAETAPAPPAATSCTPLLPEKTPPDEHTPPDNPPCDIKLVINGCTYNEREAGIPLLADA